MGLQVSKLFERLFGKAEMRILMVRAKNRFLLAFRIIVSFRSVLTVRMINWLNDLRFQWMSIRYFRFRFLGLLEGTERYLSFSL